MTLLLWLLGVGIYLGIGVWLARASLSREQSVQAVELVLFWPFMFLLAALVLYVLLPLNDHAEWICDLPSRGLSALGRLILYTRKERR